MARKSLDDILSNDRSVSRAAQNREAIGTGSLDDIFGDDGEPNRKFSNVAKFEPPEKSNFYSNTPKCYHSHPPLKLPGSDLVIYGGSCNNPSVLDADVYVGFDSGMRFTQRHWPWKKGAEVLFKITDMNPPDDAVEFEKLIKWVRKQLEAGLKVHCGCIGGHGRTGTFLAALCKDFGEEDAINYVRKNYCHKAVESSSQIEFLHKHFGIKKVAASKDSFSKPTALKNSNYASKTKLPKEKTFHPLSGASIWD